jgi:hypothetical protein
MSRGRIARPEIAFSTAGTITFRRQVQLHDHARQSQYRGSPAHVLFHQMHAGRGLDVQPAGVKTHALADQRQQRAAITPIHRHDPRRPVRCTAHGVNHRKVLRQQVVAPLHPGLRAEIAGQGKEGLLQLGGA